MSNLFDATQYLVNECLNEQDTLLNLWKDTSNIEASLQFFCQEYNISLNDFNHSADNEEDSMMFVRLMNQNLEKIDSNLWKDIQNMQKQSLERKISFFEQGHFSKLSAKVLESFQTLCIFELNRLIYLFKGIKMLFEKNEFISSSQAYYDIFSYFLTFLKGNLDY